VKHEKLHRFRIRSEVVEVPISDSGEFLAAARRRGMKPVELFRVRLGAEVRDLDEEQLAVADADAARLGLRLIPVETKRSRIDPQSFGYNPADRERFSDEDFILSSDIETRWRRLRGLPLRLETGANSGTAVSPAVAGELRRMGGGGAGTNAAVAAALREDRPAIRAGVPLPGSTTGWDGVSPGIAMDRERDALVAAQADATLENVKDLVNPLRWFGEQNRKAREERAAASKQRAGILRLIYSQYK
jgi:hypothetical protein